jgi:hypothetical protein
MTYKGAQEPVAVVEERLRQEQDIEAARYAAAFNAAPDVTLLSLGDGHSSSPPASAGDLPAELGRMTQARRLRIGGFVMLAASTVFAGIASYNTLQQRVKIDDKAELESYMEEQCEKFLAETDGYDSADAVTDVAQNEADAQVSPAMANVNETFRRKLAREC